MAVLPDTLKRIAESGANLVLTKESRVLSPTIEEIVGIAVSHGGHVTIDADLLLAPTLESVAKRGGKHVTIRV